MRSLPEGVYVAAITPRRNHDSEIDLAAALELIDFLVANGVKGIAVLGSTGEFPHFDSVERIRLVSFAAKRSRVPVVAGVSHSTLDSALILAREAASAGAAAVLVMPPYFFRYQQSDIRTFYLRFADEFEDAAPILLYNMPGFSNPIGMELAIELLGTGSFAGIKDSSGDYDNFLRLKPICREKNLKLLVGYDSLYARARAEGASGIISGVASAVPELLRELDAAVMSGASGKKDRLDARLREFIAWIDRFPAPVGIREATRLRGIKTGPAAVPPDRELLARFGEWFLEWLPEVQGECKV